MRRFVKTKRPPRQPRPNRRRAKASRSTPAPERSRKAFGIMDPEWVSAISACAALVVAAAGLFTSASVNEIQNKLDKEREDKVVTSRQLQAQIADRSAELEQLGRVKANLDGQVTRMEDRVRSYDLQLSSLRDDKQHIDEELREIKERKYKEVALFYLKEASKDAKDDLIYSSGTVYDEEYVFYASLIDTNEYNSNKIVDFVIINYPLTCYSAKSRSPRALGYTDKINGTTLSVYKPAINTFSELEIEKFSAMVDDYIKNDLMPCIEYLVSNFDMKEKSDIADFEAFPEAFRSH